MPKKRIDPKIDSMPDLPDGVVTFLFTDVQGSTRMWEESPNLMMRALEQHDEAIDEAVAANNGVSVKPRGEGDSRFVVFRTALDAVSASAEMQRRLAAVDWVIPHPLTVRASLHTGTADLRLGDYYGSAVNRAARLRAIAHGGQTIMSRSTWELVQDQLPEGVTVRDLGEHGLKDLTRPERVFQVGVAGLPDAFPPLTSIDAVPNNLPQQLTEFVGRQAELEEAKRLLVECRLLTILASGGAGKTRLAIQAAADVTGDYPDGVFHIALADISSSSDIIQTIAEALGVGLSSDRDPKTQLLTYLANKRQLLVFDNFDHLVDGASLVSEILVAAPNIAVVATSRIKLGLMGETVFTLSGLETTWEQPEQAFQASGVVLFIDAATRADPGFSLEVRDLDAVAQILQMTGGLPLGILLAAAWVDMLPVQEIAAEIAKSLDFLETEMQDVPDRHRSVRAVFDYSWALLDEDERRVFAALSVFRGGFTREAAQQVAGASLRNLATLASKSLVMPSPDTGRYAVHELLRQYAEGELNGDHERSTEVQEAHAAFFATLMEDALRLLFRCDHPLLVATVERDIDNIRAAWRHYLSTHNAAGAHKFVAGLNVVYELRGWYQAAVAFYGEALEALDGESDDEATGLTRASALMARAFFLALIGQPEKGAAGAAAAVELLRSSADPFDHWLALQSYAQCLGYLGRMDEMVEILDEGIAKRAGLDDPYWVAGLKNWRSFAAVVSGDADTAVRLIPEAMTVFEQRDDHYFTVWNLWLQAMIATQQGRPQAAIDLYTRQVARAREVGYPRSSMVALEGLGDANVAEGRFEAADTAFIQSLVTAEQMGMVSDMLGLMTKIGKARAALGSSIDAVEVLAAVCAEPMSEKQFFTDTTPIREAASAALDELKEVLDPNEFSAARAKGASTPFLLAVKGLLDSLNR